MNEAAERARRHMSQQTKIESLPKDDDFLSTGVSLIDLAAYGQIGRGVVKGKIYWIVGRSESGKSFLSRTIMAEASIKKSFDEYEFIYDDIERGSLMNTAKFFGNRLAERIRPPARTATKRLPVYSSTVSDWVQRVYSRLEDEKKFIWVLDSLDALRAEDNQTKMGDGKAKALSQGLRELLDGLEATGSIVILISQAKTDLRSMWGGETTAGGLSPRFYATWCAWLKKLKAIKVPHKGVKYNAGHMIGCKMDKNRLSGKHQFVTFPFDPDYGIDDLGANVDYLLRTKHWKKSGGVIDATELGHRLKRNALIKAIEDDGAEQEVQRITASVWKEISDAITIVRKPRYE